MGYTHYWKRKKEIPLNAMRNIVDDFRKTLPCINEYVDLSDGDGKGSPRITYNSVSFNGRVNCGHPKEDLGITWPSDKAGGIANPYKEAATNGSWFAGAQLTARRCGGDCSHETFSFPRIMHIEKWQESQNEIYREVCGKIGYHYDKDFYFEFCKTAFKPYDVAVITFLIIAKHHLKDDIIITSDGHDQHWWSGKYTCYMALDYGMAFELTEEGLILK